MANQFDVTPADPLGTLNTFQGELADTAFKQARAKTAQIDIGIEEDKAASSHEAYLASQAFRDKVTKIDPSVKPMEKLNLIADAAMSTGRFEDAEKALAGMSHLAQVGALQSYRDAQASAAAAKVSDTKMKRAMELATGVNSPEDKKMADTLFEAEFGEPSPFAQTPYSPEFKKFVTGTLGNALTQAKIKREEAATLKDDAATRKSDLLTKAQKDLLEARTAAVKNKDADLAKAGGKIASATKSDKDTTAAVLKDFFPDLKNADIATEEVAQEAKAVLARREAPDFTTAVKKVIKENPGRFKEEDPKGIAAMFKGKQTSYSSKEGGGEGKGTPLPPKGSPLTVGQAYTNSSGVTKTWTGEGWK